MEYATERLDLRTVEADAMEAEELQNAMNQSPDGGVASGADVGEPGVTGSTAGGEAVADNGTSKTGPKGGLRLRDEGSNGLPYRIIAVQG